MVEETNIKEGYQKTEVGIIPNDWKISQIGDEFDIKLGKMLDSEKNVGTPKFYLNNKAVQWNRIDVNDLPKILIAKSELERYKLHFGDLLVCEGGEVGRAAIWENQIEECYFQKALHRLRPKKEFNTRIMLALFHYWSIHNKLAEYVSQTSIAHLTREKLAIIPLPVPPQAEQTAIATALNDADALITRLEELIAKKRAVKQGAMQELLKPKDGWEVKKLGEIGSFKNGINKASSDFGFGHPFVNLLDVFGRTKISSNLKLELLNSNAVERKLYNLIEGDVLFIRSSVKPEGVGLTCLIENDLKDVVFSGFIIRFRDSGFLSKEFKEYCFHTKDFRDRLLSSSTVSANTNINQEALKNLDVSFPKSKTEQSRIARILSDVDEEIEALEKKLEKYKQIKIGMMQNLLTGKIRLV